MNKFLGFLAVVVTATAALMPAAPALAEEEDVVVPSSIIVAPSAEEGVTEESEGDDHEGQDGELEQDSTSEVVLPDDGAAVAPDARPDVPDESRQQPQVEDESPEGPVVVTVGAPTKMVIPCHPPMSPEQRFVKIGFVEGVQFFVNDTLVDESSFLVEVLSHEAVITAVALEGYVIEGDSEWFIPFDYKECPSDIVLPELRPPFKDGVVLPPNDTVIPTGYTTDVVPSNDVNRPATLAVTGTNTTANLVMVIAAILAAFGLVTMLRKLPSRRARKRQ